MKRRVLVKMVEDKDFKPTLKFATKVWVHLPSGEYFYIHQGHIGQWYQSFALYMDYPSEHAAVEAGLAHILHPNVYGPEKYKALRVRERCFSPDVPSVKQALHDLRCEKRKRPSVKTKALKDALTPAQRKLARKHGTPPEFAKACYECVPGSISMDEARAATEKYVREWNAAGRS